MLTRLLRSETVLSIFDQAAVSGGNFLTTLVLARILVPAEYGVFSLLFLSLFAINTCHSSLVVYPLTLRGASSPAELGRLTCAALLHSLILAVPLAVVLAIITFALHQLYLWPVMAIAMLAWQLQETVRRALLSVLRFRSAFLPDLLCYAGQGVILALWRPQSLAAIFWVVAGTSAIAAVWQFLLITMSATKELPGLMTYTRKHGVYAWQMGRFVLAGNALNMVTLQVPAWTLALAYAPATVAGYQSLLNLVGVANPIIFSINSMLIPAIAKEVVHGFRRARQTAVHYGLRYGVLLLPAFLAMLLAPHLVMRLVYGANSPYPVLSPLLRIFVIAFVLQYLATVAGAYEGGMSRPKTYMWVQVAGTGILVLAGIPLIFHFGIAGAVNGMLLASVARLLTVLILAHRADRHQVTSILDVTDPLMETHS